VKSSISPLVHSPTIHSTKHSSPSPRGSSPAPHSINDANAAESHSIIPPVFDVSSPTNLSDRLPGLLSRRPSYQRPFPFQTCQPWRGCLKEEEACAFYSVFTRNLGATVVKDLEDRLYETLDFAQGQHDNLEATMREAGEEILSEFKSTSEDFIRDIENLISDGLYQTKLEIERIGDDKILEVSSLHDQWTSKARELVSEKSQIEKAKKHLKKKEARLMKKEKSLMEKRKKLKQKRRRLRKQEKRLGWIEKIYAGHQPELGETEPEHRKEKAVDTSETEDE
jgi:hypothetical protein